MEKGINRNSIVEKAREIFARYGFRKTTMHEIAEGVGKGKSSLYYYFSSKEDVYRAVIEKEAETMKKKLIDAVSAENDPVEKFRIYVIARMEILHELVNFHQAFTTEYLTNLDFIQKMRKKYDHEEVLLLKSILQLGADKGTFRIEDVELTALAVATALKGLEVPLLTSHNEISIEKRIDRIMQILFYGIVKR
ncbi:MAG: TetR/AcrR family transcriptional regulator [Bacteroidota bacterium]|nr:TetR/AcrR family transcriptional regulator [Bacteroidota bacterium]